MRLHVLSTLWGVVYAQQLVRALYFAVNLFLVNVETRKVCEQVYLDELEIRFYSRFSFLLFSYLYFLLKKKKKTFVYNSSLIIFNFYIKLFGK